VRVYVGEIKHYTFMNGAGSTVALNTFHSPDPKLLISGACCNTESYEKNSHSLGMEQFLAYVFHMSG